MNQPEGNTQGQPTHEATRVVIPFDIDLEEVNRKVDELERRIKALTASGQTSTGPNITPLSSPDQAGDRFDQDRQLMMVTIQRIDTTLRNIDSFIQLIYAEMQNG